MNKSQQYNNQQPQLILTQTQKLSLIDQIITQYQPNFGLSLQRTDQPFTNNNQNNSSPSYYQILGVKNNRKTQNSNLIQKIQHLNQNMSQQKNQNQDENQQANNHNNQAINFRYFSSNGRCFRCRRKGHYKSVCPQQYSCIYCLSFDHNYQKCPQKIVCYRCYDFGHVVNECSQPHQGPFCNSCKRKHHDACFFLTKGIQQVKQMFNTDILYNNQQIRCMVCLKYGHIICNNNNNSNNNNNNNNNSY